MGSTTDLSRPSPNCRLTCTRTSSAAHESGASLLLLLKKVFNYRHLSQESALETELDVLRKLEDAAAKAAPGSNRRQSLDRLNEEWGTGRERVLDLAAVVLKLEDILRTQ